MVIDKQYIKKIYKEVWNIDMSDNELSELTEEELQNVMGYMLWREDYLSKIQLMKG